MRDQAIYNLYPNVVSINAGKHAFDANGNIVSINEQQVLVEVARLQANYDSKEYQRLRAAEYPPLTDQLDMQYHDAINGTTTWQDAINAVKAKYPKPEGV